MSPLGIIFGCVAFGAAVVFSMICTYKLDTYQGWRAVVRKITPHKKASLALHEGETLVAVVEMHKGTYFFLGTNPRKGSYSE